METKIFKIIKDHRFAVIIAVILGILMISPFFYFKSVIGDDYKGVLNQVIDDELFYMARIKDVMDGHPTLGNAYLLEHKDQLPQQLFLPEFLLAQPLKALNLDIVQGRILYNFILPAFVFLLTYMAFYRIFPSRLWANIFSVLLIFGLYLFKFTRPVIPQFIFIFWLTQFILLWLLVKNKDNDISLYHRIFKKWLLLLNVLNFGLLFYLYPFYWTFYLVFLVVLSLLYFFGEKLSSKKLLMILVGGLLIGSFYFYLTFLANQLPEYQETLTRIQLVFSRSPSEIKTVFPAFFVLILFGVLYRLKLININKKTLFFISGIISILLITNQNILTGQKFEFGHYRMPAVFFLVFATYYLWNQTKQKFKFLVASLIIITSAGGVYNYTQRIFEVSKQSFYTQKYAAIFDWLNENTFKDSVVYANEEISELIPVYTSNNVFYSRNVNLFLISDDEVLERFVFNNFFEKFDRDFVIENERAIWGVRYIDRYGDAVQANKWRRLLGFNLKDETPLPEEEINKVLSYAEGFKRNNFEDNIEKYRIDYLVWDKSRNSGWKLSDQAFLAKVFETDSFVVYKNEKFNKIINP